MAAERPVRRLVDRWWLRAVAGLQVAVAALLFTSWGPWALGAEVGAIFLGLVVWAFAFAGEGPGLYGGYRH